VTGGSTQAILVLVKLFSDGLADWLWDISEFLALLFLASLGEE
jgi:hypothetical protein